MAKFERATAHKNAAKQQKLLRKQMKTAAREGNTQFDEQLLDNKVHPSPPGTASHTHAHPHTHTPTHTHTHSHTTYTHTHTPHTHTLTARHRTQRKARFEQERLGNHKAELNEMAFAAREREAASMAKILGMVNKSALGQGGGVDDGMSAGRTMK